MEYKIKDLCNTFRFGVSKFYKMKNELDNSIPEQNRIEYYYNKGRNFYITDKGFDWFKNNLDNYSKTQTIKNNSSSNITTYESQIIDIYKERIEYLENENKRLLDIISVKEQKELAKDMKQITSSQNSSFFDRFFNRFRN